MRVTVIVFFLCLNFVSWAQETPEREFYKRLDEGENFMKTGQYEEANDAFLFVIGNMRSLPPKVAYFFGRNSYHLGQYKQSINWLNKYIQIQGTTGPYYEQAQDFLRLAEKRFVELQGGKGDISDLTTPGYFDCQGFEKMICPVCKGDGVIIKSNAFGNNYTTCHACSGKAYLSCDDYNLFMQGRLEAVNKE